MGEDFEESVPCVCGFGEEFFAREGDRNICTVCGGIVGVSPEPVEEITAGAVGRTVVIVDDQAFFRQRVSLSLREQGHEVIEAVDGLAALRTIGDICLRGRQALSARVDVLILDLVMPGDLDGFQTLAAVKALLPDLPVIVLTASPPRKELLEKLARLGAKKYLNKSAANLDDLVLKNVLEA